MRSTDNPRIAELRAIGDPVQRAAACQTFIVNGRATLKAAESLRDESIRAARKSTTSTVDALASAINVKRNVVVQALRRGD
jgi:DNA-binding transcriptional regulator YiaG